MAHPQYLNCCLCGLPAGKWQQHPNRDAGYGICVKCVADELGRRTPEDMQALYGTPGINHDTPLIREQGRRYQCRATFPHTPAGTEAANDFLTRHPETSILCVSDAIYIANTADRGTPVT